MLCVIVSLLRAIRGPIAANVDQDQTAHNAQSDLLCSIRKCFYAPAPKDRGHIALPLSICPSLSSQTYSENLKFSSNS